MSNTFPGLDEKFIEPNEPSIEYLRKTFKKVGKLINKLHKFLKSIDVEYDDIKKIVVDDDEEYIIIHIKSSAVQKKIIDNEDETDLNIDKCEQGVSIKIE